MAIKKPLVSVIITTKNEEGVIERLLRSVKGQNYRRIEVIVVDNNSTDKTRLLATKFTKFVYISGPERSAQRNFGARKSKGKYLLFLDADMKLDKNVIKDCVLRVDSSSIGAVVIPERSIANNLWEKVKAFERSFYNETGDEVTDAARFYPRKVFFEVGGYDEGITGPEDWDLPERVSDKGYKVARARPVIYHYERIDSPLSLAKKKFYYGLRVHKYLAKHGKSAISPKTLYFLRPVFYKKWKILIKNPGLSFVMFAMLTLEQIAGGLGYILGGLRHE